VKINRLTDHLTVCHGDINAGILAADDRALFLDFGDGGAACHAEEVGLCPDWVLFTHYHRDQGTGLRRYENINVAVPGDEKHLFTDVEGIWRDEGNHYHRYHFQPQLLMFRHAVEVNRELRDGDEFIWNGHKISAIATPGHTQGSLSYLVNDGGGRYVFVGDLLTGNGKLPDIWSLQLGNEYFRDYHGFMGAAGMLKQSLGRVIALKPDAVIPARGRIIYDTDRVLGRLCRRLDEVFHNYTSISSACFYFPQAFPKEDAVAGRLEGVQLCSLPEWVLVAPTSRLLVDSERRRAFVIDCGNQQVLQIIEDMRQTGRVQDVMGVYITHYHDDHVDYVNELVNRYGCPVYAAVELVDILQRPAAYNMPCQTKAPVQVTHHLRHGEGFQLGDFRFTNYFFPGQTLYHGALLVEGRDRRLLFAGDSFTPGGVDDYCVYNRNLPGAGRGLLLCIDIIRQVKPDMIVNQHVEAPFVFREAHLGFMERKLREREKLLRDLLPWDDPGFGLDPYWVRFFPYEQRVPAGGTGETAVVVTNHSCIPLEIEVELHIPADWWCQKQKQQLVVPAKGEGTAGFRFVTGDEPGLRVTGASVTTGGQRYSEITQGLVWVLG